MNKRITAQFKQNLVGFNLSTLEKHPDSIYGLSKDLLLSYFNPSWFKFADENNGEPILSETYPLGTPIEKCLLGDINPFYMENYSKVLKSGKVWHHEYECSSANEMRIYTKSTYPLKNNEGLVVVNRIRKKSSMTRTSVPESSFNGEHYTHSSGFIHQCCNCRCIQRVDDENIWEWIEEWVIKIPDNASHSICPVCFDYYWKLTS